MKTLQGKVAWVTGASRGIGRAIAEKFASEGATVIVTGKSLDSHPKLPGSLREVAEAINSAGGTALPLQLDVRDGDAITEVTNHIIQEFGGLDILVNNAGALSLSNTLNTTLKRFDLLISINARGAFACSQAAIPHLMKRDNPHILNISPALKMDAKWFKDYLPYSYSKYGMSICTLGMSAEFKEQGIAVNSLWPRTTIATDAVKVHFPKSVLAASRKPTIMADAAYWVVTQDSRHYTGNFVTDEQVMRDQGMDDLSAYSLDPEKELQLDFYVEE